MNTLQAKRKSINWGVMCFAISLCMFTFGSCTSEYKGRISDLEYENQRLKNEVSDLEYRIDELEDYLDDLEEIIDDAYDQAVKLRSDLIIWEDDIWMISGDVNGLIMTLQY